MPSEGRLQVAAQIVQIEVFATRALRGPDEALAILQETQPRRIDNPTGRPFLAHDHPALSRFGIGGAKFQDVLPAVRAVKKQLLAISGPGDAVHIMAQHGILEGLAIARINRDGAFAGEIVNQQVGDGIGRARLGIGFNFQMIVEVGQIAEQIKIAHAAFIKAIKCDLIAIGWPPDGGRLIQFLAINPACGAVLEAGFFAAVLGDGEFIRAVGVAQPKISFAIKRLPNPVR